VPGIYTAYLIF